MENLLFGLQVTVLGMGIVFGLLALLWLLLTLVLRLERRGRPEPGAVVAGPSPAPGSTPGPAPAPGPEAVPAPAPVGETPPEAAPPGSPAVRLVGAPAHLEPGLVAAIGVVVLRHVETRRRQAAPAMRTNWPGSLLFASRWVAAGRARQARSWTRRGR